MEVVTNGDWYRHLTHWTWWAHGWILLGLLAEWGEGERKPLRDSLLNIGSNLGAGIVGGMVVIYVEDDSILDQAAKDYGEVQMQLGNVLLHFLPPLFYWLFLFLSSPPHPRTRYTEVLASPSKDLVVTFISWHVFSPCYFFLTYASMFSAQEEYGENITTSSLALTILAFTITNHYFFSSALLWRNKVNM